MIKLMTSPSFKRIPKGIPSSRLKVVVLAGAFVVFGMQAPFALAAQPTSEQIKQFQSLPQSQQDALMKQYGGSSAVSGAGSNTSSVGLPSAVKDIAGGPVLAPSNVDAPQVKTAEADAPKSEVAAQVKKQIKPFGYDLFSGNLDTFAPLMNSPVPKGYVMGPGDTLNVQVYGANNQSLQLAIDRNGDLQVPNVGPMQVAGLQFEEVAELVKSRIKDAMMGVDVSVTAGALRSIRVFVLGDVNKPGAYVVSGLSTISNALLASGGIRSIGSLRGIEVKRNGKVVSRLDLYDFLLKGDMNNDITLLDGDVVFIPTIKTTVTVTGEVNRPAVYELKNEKTLADVVKLAGGFNQGASPAFAKLERIRKDGYRTIKDINLLSDAQLKQRVLKGDKVIVPGNIDEFKQVVSLSGSLNRTGEYQWQAGLRIADLFQGDAADIFKAKTDLEHVFIRRQEGVERNVRVLMVNLGEAISNPNSLENAVLEPRDEVIVLSFDDDRVDTLLPLVVELERQTKNNMLPKTVSVTGSVQYPGDYPLASEMSVQDLVSIAGGASLRSLEYAILKKESAYNRKVSARLINLNSDLSKVMLSAQDELIVLDSISSTDELSQRKKAIDKIDSASKFDENESEFTKNLTASEALKNKQLQTGRERLDALIKRLKQQATDVMPAQIVSVEGFVKFPGQYPLMDGMHAQDLIAIAGGMQESAYTMSGELVSRSIDVATQEMKVSNQIITLDSMHLMKLGLQSMDSLIIKRKPDWAEREVVTLTGEVKFPGTYVLLENETLSDVIKRAGGLTKDAFVKGTVLQRADLLSKQTAELDKARLKLQAILAQNNAKGNSSSASGVGTTEASEYLARVIAQANEAQATGRLSLVDRNNDIENSFKRVVLKDQDRVNVPSEPRTVAVIGEVFASQTFNYDNQMDAMEYLQMAGGANSLADMDRAYIVKASGRVVPLKESGFFYASSSYSVEQGDVIVVPMDVEKLRPIQLWREVATITGQIGIALASFKAIGVF